MGSMRGRVLPVAAAALWVASLVLLLAPGCVTPDAHRTLGLDWHLYDVWPGACTVEAALPVPAWVIGAGGLAAATAWFAARLLREPGQ